MDDFDKRLFLLPSPNSSKSPTYRAAHQLAVDLKRRVRELEKAAEGRAAHKETGR